MTTRKKNATARTNRKPRREKGIPLGTRGGMFWTQKDTVRTAIVTPGVYTIAVIYCRSEKEAEEVCLHLRDRVENGRDTVSKNLRNRYCEPYMLAFLNTHIPDDVKRYSQRVNEINQKPSISLTD